MTKLMKQSHSRFFHTALYSLILLLSLSVAGIAAAAVDLNSASAEAIASGLKGVGLKKAQAIVAYRNQVGGFKQANDLLQVKGVGQKLLDRNKGNYVLNPVRSVQAGVKR